MDDGTRRIIIKQRFIRWKYAFWNTYDRRKLKIFICTNVALYSNSSKFNNLFLHFIIYAYRFERVCPAYYYVIILFRYKAYSTRIRISVLEHDLRTRRFYKLGHNPIVDECTYIYIIMLNIQGFPIITILCRRTT